MSAEGSPARPRSRPTAAVLLTLVLPLLPTACGGNGGSGADATSRMLSRVLVSGKVGDRPAASFQAPLQVAGSGWREIRHGTGAPISVDEQFLLQLTMVDGRTGKRAISTLDPGQTVKTLRSSDEDLFPVLHKALAGRRQGARLCSLPLPRRTPTATWEPRSTASRRETP